MCYNLRMDFAHPTNAKPSRKKRSPLGILIWTAAGLMLTAVILVAAAPTILSIAPVRAFVFDAVNRQIAPASIHADSWSLAWFGEQSVTGLSYTDPGSGIGLNVASLSLGSIWSLIPIGRTETAVMVDTPALTVIPVSERPEPTAPPAAPGSDVAAATPPFVLPDWDIGATFVIRNGSVRVLPQPTPFVSKINLTVVMPSFDAPCTVRATADLLEAELLCAVDTASLRAVLGRRFPLPDSAMLNIKAPWGQADLRATANPATAPLPVAALSADLDLGALFARAADLGLAEYIPLSEIAGHGRINAAFTPSSADRADAELLLTLSDIRAVRSGNTLRCDDTLTFRTAVSMDRSASVPVPGLSDGLPIRNASCDLSAPWGSIGVTAMPSGIASAVPKTDLHLHLKLPEFQRFAAGLGLSRQRLRMEHGELTGTLAVSPHDADLVDIDLAVRPSDVRCSWEGKPLSVSPNVDLSARVDIRAPLTSEVRRLSVEFPGLLASGSGSLRKGELAAALDVRELMRLAEPFTDVIPVADPLSVTLRLASDKERLDLTARAKSDRATLGNLNLRLSGLDPEARRFAAATLKSDFDLGALMRFCPIGSLPLRTAEAHLLLNATADGTGDAIRARTVFALRDTDLRTTAWHIKEGELLSGSAELTYMDGAVAVPTLSLKSPVLTAEGAMPTSDPLKLSLTGTVTPERIFSVWKVWGRDETPFGLDGSVGYTFTAGFPALALKAESDDFRYLPAGGSALPLPFALDTAVVLESPDASALRIDRLTLTGPYADCSATGTFRDGRLSVAGDLTPDFAAIWALPAFDSARQYVTLSGRHTRPFAFDAPVTDGLPGIVSYGKASAELALDRIDVPGLDITDATLKASLSDAVLTVDGKTAMNGGTLRLNPSVALGMPPYTVTLPQDSLVIDRFELTQKMLDTGLCYIAPVLSGSASPHGTFSLNARHFRMTLDDDPLASLEADLTFSTESVSVAPNGLLGNLLAMLRLRERAAFLPDQNLPISVRGAELTTGELSMRIAALKLRCSGTTDLSTGKVAYSLTVPLTEQLLGERVSRYIGTQDMVIPIRGTVNDPQADTSVIARLLGSAVDNAVTREVGRQVENLFNGKTPGAVRDFTEDTVNDGIDTIREGADALFNLFH